MADKKSEAGKRGGKSQSKKPVKKAPAKKKAVTKAKRPRPTTTKLNPVADTTNWRRQLMVSRLKFDDEQKEIYLRELAEHGRKGDASKAAGVSLQCTRNHIKNDPDFAEAALQAEEQYRDKIVGHAGKLLYEGIEVKRYNKDGDLIEERRDYPIRLIELELKRVEPGYRDKQTIDVNSGGGVLVAPADMTPAEWIAQQEALNAQRTAAEAGHAPPAEDE